MKFAISTVVGLAFVATCLALPIDFNVGLDLKPGDVDFWKTDITIKDQKIQLGVGWTEGDNYAVGAKLITKVNGHEVPFTAAVSTNINDLKQIRYQVATKMDDKVAGIVYGDANGAVQYQVNAKVPLESAGSPVKSIGASLEGSGLHPTSLTGGVSVGKEVILAKALFFDSYAPTSINFGVASDESIIKS